MLHKRSSCSFVDDELSRQQRDRNTVFKGIDEAASPPGEELLLQDGADDSQPSFKDI